MIDSLLSLTASRPDIMYSLCLCARFQACPKESYLNEVDEYTLYSFYPYVLCVIL